jgi:hypothetical protein
VAASPYQDTGLTPGTGYTYQISAVDAAGNESPKTAPTSATTSGGQSTGIPFGIFSLFSGPNKPPENVVSFNLSQDRTTWDLNSAGTRPQILDRLDEARARGLKLVTAMTGGNHSRYLKPKFPGSPDSVFDIEKWKHGNPDPKWRGSGMDGYRRPDIQAAVAQAIADGVMLGDVLMDEPQNGSWGGVMTKPMLDEMARYSKAIFPTLAVGLDFGPRPQHWRPTEHYEDVDFVNHQYNWWVTKGNVAQFRDSAFAWDARDGVRTGFSINVLDGGIPAVNDGTWNCLASTGGRGTYEPACRVTASQLHDWGLFLGPLGMGFKLWDYRDDMMSQPAYQQAAADIAADLRNRPAKTWYRP